ncbi:restriction endonuclease subunit S [Lactobacillus johnsonii]|uniref:restriction endonuclease subunit S n=1 Tax=Lactobacillus johnsonii TaxID=33959 RepID=UPI00201AE9D6|nr:restriction endonuclease subunit S [Lactobacillus johnsonii]
MTKSDDKRVPVLRFKGFTDEWEQRKLGEICKVTKLAGFEFTKYVNYSNTGSILAIRGINVKKGKFNLQDVKYIDNSNFSRLSRSKLQEGDILFTYVGTIGNSAIVPKNVNWYLAPNVCLIRPQDKNSSFISYLIQSDRFQHEEIPKWITTSSQPALSMENIRKFKIILPLNSEQQKISSLVSKIDKLITLQQRKLRQLKLLKNALLKRMFTAKKSPTLRFRDFSKDWKLHKLQDITDRLDNARVPVTASKRIAGSTPYYGANGIQDYVKGYTHDGEFLLVAEDGANNINDYPVICAKGKIWVNNHAHVLQAKNKKIDILFLMYALKFLNMKKYLVGGSRSKLNAETMMKLALKLPELDEEHNIGVLIKNMDVLITQYKYRIQKINKFKQFLLQNMFI